VWGPARVCPESLQLRKVGRLDHAGRPARTAGHPAPAAGRVGLAVQGGLLVVEPRPWPRYNLPDPTEGHGQKGRRPVLIVSPERFNRVTKVPVVLPITSGGNFARTAGFTVTLGGAETKTRGIVRCWRRFSNNPSKSNLDQSAGGRARGDRLWPLPGNIGVVQLTGPAFPGRGHHRHWPPGRGPDPEWPAAGRSEG